MGKGERYEYSLRRVFEMTKSEFNKLSDILILRMTIKAINDMMVSHVLAPSLLVFWTLPKIIYTSNINPKQIERFEAVKLARSKI